MQFHRNRKKIILSLLCVMFCISFTACVGQTSSDDSSFELDLSSLKNIFSKVPSLEDISLENITLEDISLGDISLGNTSSEDISLGDTSTITQSKNFDISIPQEITMEFFGLDLLKANRPIWEMHIWGINETEFDNYNYSFSEFSIGDYKVNHSYSTFGNEGNFSSFIDYHDMDHYSQIQFDENNNLSQIDICSDMGEEFSTSFLKVGDNVKDYFESCKPGLWEKFLNDEKIVAQNGWRVERSTITYPDYTLNTLQLYNSNLVISYFIKDDLVYHIMLTVIGNLTLDEELLAEVMSIYHLDSFNFYINDADISTMSLREWMDLFNFSEFVKEEKECKDAWMDLLDFSDEHFKKAEHGEYWGSCNTTLTGTEILASFNYNEDTEWKNIYISLHPKDSFDPTSPYFEDPISYGLISFSISRDGYFNISFYAESSCPEITGDQIMPGDNIKTFLNSYEDGLYEKLVSSSSDLNEYRTGPYIFQYYRDPECISVRKCDARCILPIEIFFENEIVTAINRSYRGRVTSFEDEPSIW